MAGRPPRTPRRVGWPRATGFFAGERHRAAVGVASYAVAGLAAVWYPVADLVVICVLPVFYGATSTGWRVAGGSLTRGDI
jgi:hypothetical protein